MKLVLLPGMDGTGWMFGPFVKALPAGLSAMVLPLPSEGPQDYDSLLASVEASLPIDEDFAIVGESFSGPLAILLATRKPTRLRALILCASFACNPLPIALGPLRKLVCPALFRLTPFFAVKAAMLGFHSDPEVVSLFRQSLRAVTPEILSSRAKAVLQIDVRPQLRQTSLPILSLQATRDRLISRRALYDIQQCRSDVQIVKFPTPHLLLQTQPDASARAIQDFLQTT